MTDRKRSNKKPLRLSGGLSLIMVPVAVALDVVAHFSVVVLVSVCVKVSWL